MAKIWEIRTTYIGKGKKIRAWRAVEHCPLAETILKSQANFEVYCDDFMTYSGYAQYASDGQLAEAILDDLDLDACEVCNAHMDVGAVVYKEWP